MKEQNKIALTFDPAVLDQIASRCTEVETGARNVDHILKGKVMPALSQTIIENMTTGKMPERIHIGVDAKGEFTYKNK
jgi:type VI secretion system protein VasG